ncbi:MAG TPA: hypothetical protein ENN43_07035 [bacterium]|nr:hypothetical protein [bacterium]
MKRFILTAVLMMLFAPFTAAAEEDDYLAAMEAYNKKDFVKAGELLKNFNSKYPGSRFKPNVLIKMGELSHEFERMEAFFFEVIKGYSNTEYEAEAVYLLGRAHYGRGEYKKAEGYFGTILGRFSNTVWIEPAYYYLILSLNAMKNRAEAKKLYDDYIANKNNYMFRSRVKLAGADISFEEGKFEEAASGYRDIIDTFNESEKYIFLPAVYEKLIESYEKAGKERDAEKFRGDMRQLFPGYKTGTAQILASPTRAAVSVAAARATPFPTAAPAVKGNFFTVQVGAFTNSRFADDMVKRLSKKGRHTFTKTEGRFTRVYVGRFKTKGEADKYAEVLSREEKINNYLVKEGWD